MENIKYLLKKLSLVYDKTAIRKLQEEHFNVFTTLLNQDDEVYLHSRFISSMLDPHGSHKFGFAFLDFFLEIIDSNFTYDKNSVEIIPSSENWTEYKEIDILLIDRHRQNAVIIENKINACDSNHENEGQLERYYRRLIEEDAIPADNIEVYYLRPYRDTPPSEDSVSKSGQYKELPEKVRLISYEQEISNWVKRCTKEAYNSPFVRETLNQYYQLINIMTNNSDIQERLDIIDAISSSDDTLRSAKLLMDNFCHVQWHTIANFFNDLCSELESRGYKIVEKVDEDTITNIVFGGVKKRNISIRITFEDSREYAYTIGSDCDDELYFGLCKDDNKGKLMEIRSSILTNKNQVDDICISDKSWEFWCYFNIPATDTIYLWDFKQPGTFNLIRKENRAESIKKHLDDFEEVIKTLMK